MKRPHPNEAIKELRSSTVMRWPSLSYAALPLIIIALTVAVALIAFSLASVNLEATRGRAIDRTLRENALRVGRVLDSYAYLLWGSNGRLQSADIDEASWQQFIGVFDLQKNFAGMEALGLTTGTSPDNQTVAYVSPKTDMTQRAVGINLGQVQGLTKIMEQAARNSQTVVSDPMPNIFSTKQDITDADTGFLMFAPYYDRTLPTSTPDERLAALRGYTVALFRGDIFFDRIYKDIDLSHTRIDIYLGSQKPEDRIYTGGTIRDHDTRSGSQTITYFGKDFTFVYTFDAVSLLVWSLTYLPQILLVSALGIGMIFAGVAGYLLRSRYMRLTYEKERDVNFAKDELLSLASHQLRTPATGVKQYLGMVLQGFAGDVPEKQRTYLERAYASNNRQLHVINDILHMAKLETGRITLTERKFDIAKMLRDVVDEQREEAHKGDVTLHLHAPSQGWIVADSHMLRMVFENLVSNAIKYTPEKGVVTVRLVRRANRWVITVKDTGVGIDKSDFPKLFKQFSRINNSRSDFVTGTGVGLYLAHHLTVLHGGTIGVTSTKGRGSTFTIRLPRKL